VSLAQFISPATNTDLSLVVVNRDAARPFQTLLEELFDAQSVSVRERRVPGEEQDTVLLLNGEEVVASSPLSALQDAILLVNSDLYVTGAREVEAVEVPDVIESLEDVPFRLRGYPESGKEKFLLILVSRYIERLALESDGGTHRASFQQLSRLRDERGTRTVYEKLGTSSVDTHVYGVPDWLPPEEFGATVHGGWSADFEDSWFVTFRPDDEDGEHAALVAIETEPGVWQGFWTYDPSAIGRITRYIRHEL